MPENIGVSNAEINDSFNINYVSWPLPGDRNYASVTTSAIKNLLSKIYYLKNNLQNLSNQLSNHQHTASDISSGVLPVERGGTGIALSDAHGNKYIKVNENGNGYEFLPPSEVRNNISAAPFNHQHTASDISSGVLPVERGGIGKTPSLSDVNKVICVSSENNQTVYEFVNVNTLISNSNNNNNNNNNISQSINYLYIQNLPYNNNNINARIYIGSDTSSTTITEPSDIAYDVFNYTETTPVTSLSGGKGWEEPWILSETQGFNLVNYNYNIPGITTDSGSVSLESINTWKHLSRKLSNAVNINEYYIAVALQLNIHWNFISFFNSNNVQFMKFQKTDNTNIVALEISHGNDIYWQTATLNINEEQKLLVFKITNSSSEKSIKVYDLTSVSDVTTYNINSSNPLVEIIDTDNLFSNIGFNLKKILISGVFRLDEVRVASSYNKLWIHSQSNNSILTQLKFITYSDSQLQSFQHGAIEVKSTDRVSEDDDTKYNLRIVGPVDKKGKINFVLFKDNEYIAASFFHKVDTNYNVLYNNLYIGNSNDSQTPGTLSLEAFNNIPNANDIDNNTLFLAPDNNNNNNTALYIKLNGNIYKVNLTQIQ